MNKVVIFYGSNRAFMEVLPKSYRNLTDVVMELDKESKNMILHIPELNGQKSEPVDKEDKKLQVENFVINSDEYCGVREHVIINFANFIAKMDITNMYIQNPPKSISEQLHRIYDTSILQIIQQKYNCIDEAIIRKFNKEYDERIIGQTKVKIEVLQAIYPLIDGKQKKPVIILFYGDSGLGKTETAQYLSELLSGNLFRKQFSMYQNNEFATYLFGGNYYEGSFAKDLLDRDSNIILLDEFDKSNPVFRSAFYQLFDEGIYEEKNYKVNLDNAIIICTSNYKDEREIKENLGNAIYNRFDSIIRFDELSDESKEIIAKNNLEDLATDYQEVLDGMDEEIRSRLMSAVKGCSNAREIRRIIKEVLNLLAIRKMCGDEEVGGA
ncbi:MAG: AAA family ATPase [Roseburia sp.]|nr:AAA family ATPase [Roseburia sp.]